MKAFTLLYAKKTNYKGNSFFSKLRYVGIRGNAKLEEPRECQKFPLCFVFTFDNYRNTADDSFVLTTADEDELRKP